VATLASLSAGGSFALDSRGSLTHVVKGIVLVVVGIFVLAIAARVFSAPPESIIGVPVGRQMCEEAAQRGEPPPFPECPNAPH
jgi:hypothetical protein